ncbi:EAL domain-containing protein [Colwelliaceae bacterium 6471]
MYTFSQLLMRNALLSLLFSIGVALVVVVSSAVDLTKQQEKHQQLIQTSIKNFYSGENLSTLGESLKSSGMYKSLTLTQENTAPYTYTNSKSGFTFPFIAPKEAQFVVNENNITVKFQIDTADTSEFVLKIIITVFIISFGCAIIAVKFTLTKYKYFFSRVSRQIKKDLSLIIDTDDNHPEDDFFDFPELKTGLEEVKNLIESQMADTSILKKEAYIDSLTQIDNRSRFVHFYESQVNADGSMKFGVLIITRCSELQTINQIHGYNEGDNYICSVAQIMKAAIAPYQSAQLFRLNSSDFATILPNVTLKQAEKYASELQGKFNEYQQASDLDSVAYSGLVSIDKEKPLGELLALADTGISVAQTQQMNSWFSQNDSDILKSSSANYGNQNWRQEIEHVLDNQRITLLVQSIQPSSRNSRVYGEILARFLNSNDEMLPTASFIAMAEKLDKIVAVDRLIIETVVKEIKNKNLLEHSFGINVSARSIHDEQFIVWLERHLLREPNVTTKLIFEISEYGLQQNIKTSKRFIEMIHRVGARITVERFGVGLTSFKFFRDLKPDFIKMDSTYTRDIDDDKNNQYFLRLMVDLAHRLSIQVLAESVESQEEKHTLEKLFIDGCQGFYVGKPTPL